MQHSRDRIGTSQRVTIPLVSLAVAISVLLAMLLKAPELSTVIISELSKLLQSPAIRSNLDTLLALRYHEPLALESLSQKLLSSGERLTLDIDLRSLGLGPKMRYMFVAAAIDVSVIVPTWNEGKFLPRCLQSLNEQGGKMNFETIVVDGGSTDKTVRIAEQCADKVIIKSRQPVGAARNAGATEAAGRILAFIDADTVASEKWVETIIETLEGNSQAVGVTGPTLPYEGSMLDKRVYGVATGWFQRFSLRLGLPHVAGFNCAYRRDAFCEAGGFDESRQLSEDIMLSLRIRHQGSIVFNPDMVAYTSLRRIKKYGYTYLTTYYLMNWATMLFLNRTLAYPKVR